MRDDQGDIRIAFRDIREAPLQRRRSRAVHHEVVVLAKLLELAQQLVVRRGMVSEEGELRKGFVDLVRHRHVGQKHELFDQIVGFLCAVAVKAGSQAALGIQDESEFYLVQTQRTSVVSLSAQISRDGH